MKDNDFLMTVCTYDDVNVICNRSDGYATPVLPNFNVTLKKERNQQVAVKTLPNGGVLVAIIEETGHVYTLTMFKPNGEILKVFESSFSGCDAIAPDSYPIAWIDEESTGNNEHLYCVREVCESKNVKNLQEIHKDYKGCFSLSDIEKIMKL